MKSIVKNIHVLCKIAKGLPCNESKRELQRHRRRLQTSIQKHWKDNEILLYELIREEWNPDNIGKDKMPEIDAGAKANSTATTSKRIKGDFIVFIDREYDIDWITQNEVPEQNMRYISMAMAIGYQPNKHLEKDRLICFKQLIGESIVAAMYGDFEESNGLSIRAQAFLDCRTVECSRKWSLKYANILIINIFLLIYINYKSLNGHMDMQEYDFMLPMICGVVGAYLSVVLRVGRQKMDASSGELIHFLEILSRFIAGCLMGAVAYIILHTPLCPSIFETHVNNRYFFSLVGFIAGFSERFVPEMISSYVNTTGSKLKEDVICQGKQL